MKFVKNIMWVLLALVVVSCSNENYEIEYTPIAPMGGQYRIISIVDEAGTELKSKIGSSDRYVFLSNTVEYDSDKCWIRIGRYSYAASNFASINGKINCNVSDKSNMTFSGTNVENFAGNVSSSTSTFDVTGIVVENGATCPSKEVTESIAFTFTNSKFPGKTYKVTGWKYTGWPEDL
jgi:hypothetical protein